MAADSEGKASGGEAAVRPLDRLPPHNAAEERGLLGCILQDASRLLDLCVEKRIVEESFWVEANRAVYSAMMALYERHQPIDALSVIGRLRETGQLDAAGGEEEIFRLVDSVTTTAHAEYFIERVFEAHLMRKVIRAAGDMVGECYDPDIPAGTVLANAEAAIFDLGQDRTTAERLVFEANDIALKADLEEAAITRIVEEKI